ncbi:DUF11 domain-containing protein [Ramlibacter sp. XY19]|uniref:hypothetical protein n=1 Tax=Ramlibacter paludis TaxID=2908000 RepID=UPI0023DC60BC|nr:hypothetical protein [Ramlibacter paludis]MCG2595271.1 DUF11 domain-containing protein [Ramlibacter paludis]
MQSSNLAALRGCWLRLLAGLMLLLLAGAVAAQTLAPSFPLDMCPADRYGSSLGCTAKDVQITNITAKSGPGTPTSCVGGGTVTLDLDVTVTFGSSTRYDVGIFLAQDGGNPQLLSTRSTPTGTGSRSCKVAILPTSVFPSLDPGPYTISGQPVTDTCGDGSASTVGTGGTQTFTITGVVVKCQAADSSGALNIPFVVTWDNQASPSGLVCTSAANPVPNTTSKCNAPSGVQGNVSVVTLPQITKTNPATSITPGDTTTYTVTVSNTTGITLTSVVFKDPAVANLPTSGVSCAAQSATCPTVASTTVANMQGAGLTIPQMLPGGTVTFTINAQLTGNPTGTIVNQASVSLGSASTTASAVGTIVYPGLLNTKTVQVLRDPISGTTNPKNIPGSESLYTIGVANTGLGQVDSNSLVISDRIPPNTALFVGNLGGTPAGPITFTDSASTLTFSYTSLSSTTDDLEFSSDDGATWTYVPVPDASGFDAAVTNLRVKPRGRMVGWSGAGAYPGFSFSFKVRLN